ncbi:hypothetical protein QBC37DRAFT_19549 [Rhypophila decipiens]|uniref:Secreted protein n=1 Tax=Rhypophila decipiens TaxID=261697 RepID=A0AAN6Y1Y5_9PEZI|nr:hypothetical protein QBC37DRAFT_19549 [Rhypophila decipiens]
MFLLYLFLFVCLSDCLISQPAARQPVFAASSSVCLGLDWAEVNPPAPTSFFSPFPSSSTQSLLVGISKVLNNSFCPNPKNAKLPNRHVVIPRKKTVVTHSANSPKVSK